MHHLRTEFLPAFLSLLFALPALAERRACAATLTTNHDCYDAASVSNSVLCMLCAAVADSFYSATLMLVADNRPSQIDLITSSPSTMQFDFTSASKTRRPGVGFWFNKQPSTIDVIS